jgi:Asp/Glu/hydantoin racemase
MDAKPSSPNYKKFIDKHGSKAVELDAAPVTLLQSKLRDAINGVIDVVEFNAQFAQEAQDAAHIEAHRQLVFEAIKGVR